MGRKPPSYSQIRAINCGFRRNRLQSISVSRYTEIVLKNVLRRSKNPLGTLKFARKLSPGHQRVVVHRNSHQKRDQQIGKPPRYSRICATDYGLRRNRLRGISVSRYTEIVLKNVLRRSKKLPGTLKFARKLSSEDERVTVHRNSI